MLGTRSRRHLFGAVLDRTRQLQEAHRVTAAAAAAAAASPPGDGHIFGFSSTGSGGAPPDSTHGTETASSAPESAVAAAQLLHAALESALLPRLEAMEGRIVRRMEVSWGTRCMARAGRRHQCGFHLGPGNRANRRVHASPLSPISDNQMAPAGSPVVWDVTLLCR